MAKLSITEAAKLANKDRRTIQRAIKSGKLSATKSATGMPEIDTSELDRVYGPLNIIATLPQADATANNAAMSQYATDEKGNIEAGFCQNAADMPQANATIRSAAMSQSATGEKDKIIKLLEAQVKALQEDKEHYKILLEEERKRFDRLLPAPVEEKVSAKPPKGFWKRLFKADKP